MPLASWSDVSRKHRPDSDTAIGSEHCRYFLVRERLVVEQAVMNGPEKLAHFHGRSSCSICTAKALRSSAPAVLNPIAADA
jgi:hypothetical protein